MKDDVSIRLIRDDGAEFYIDETDWGATKINGAEAAGYEVFVEARAAGDGDLVTGRRVKARNLEISACAMNSEQNDLLRRQAVSFFTPKHDFKIYLTYLGVTRWISGTLAAFYCPAAHILEPQELSAFFLCANPYWMSTDSFGQDIASQTARWGFPYMDHPVFKTVVSVYNYAGKVVFDYDGDAPAGFTAMITADDTVVNPAIYKDGAAIRILDTMQADDRITIDTAAKTISKNGENILRKLDRSSSFPTLSILPGLNEISFGADSGENDMHVVLSYFKRYAGV